MRVVFAHDHIFVEHAGRHATSGSFPDEVLARYTTALGPVVFVGRVRHEDAPPAGLSLLSDPDVRIVPAGPLPRARRVLDAEVARAEAVVVRLPSRIGALAWLSARRLGRPTLVEVVGCAWDAYRHHGVLGRIAAPAFFLLTRALVRRSTHVIYVTSRFLQRRYPTAGVAVACSDVVFPDPDAAVLERRLARIGAGRGGAPLVLCTVGAVHVSYKGHDTVLRAMRRLKDRGIATHYRIVGGGDPRRLAGLADDLGLGADVSFLGALPHQEVLSALQECDLYVQPSRVEGLPRALLEAMSVGCPALGTRVGGIPELLVGRDLFAAGDAGDLADRIAGLDADALRRMALANVAVAAGPYCPAKLAARRDAFLRRFRADAEAAREASR